MNKLHNDNAESHMTRNLHNIGFKVRDRFHGVLIMLGENIVLMSMPISTWHVDGVVYWMRVGLWSQCLRLIFSPRLGWCWINGQWYSWVWLA